ncbi:MAG: class F sortase [Actinomycetota bacterium]|nr:class F sortase [Actinomycetota bacterium]
MPLPTTLPAAPRARRTRLVVVVAAAALVVLAVVATAVVALSGPRNSAAVADQAPRSSSVPAPQGTAQGIATAADSWAPTTPNPETAAPAEQRAVLTPVSVELPSIGVRSDLLSLDVDATGVLVPPEPYDVAGWFSGGPVPGDIGPAIIAGHVDSRAGPGVFFRLEEMRPGEAIMVTRSDGSVATFTVARVERYPKVDFPTQQVYGPTPGQELRLITCGGDFDPGRRSYLENIVVYAVLDGEAT